MSFFKKFGITFGSKKNKYLLETTTACKTPTITMNETPLYEYQASSAYKTLAMFDLNLESPKYEGAIPEATIKFYPLK